MTASAIADKPSPRDTIVRELLAQIAAGRLVAGTKLMATQRLAKHFGVAAKTAQAAVAELSQRGLVTRCPGRGTFVVPGAADHLTATSQTVGLILSCRGHIWGEFTSQLMQGLRDLPVKPYLIDSYGLRPEAVARLPAFDRLVESAPAVIVTQSEAVARVAAVRCPHSRVIALEAPGDAAISVDLVTPSYYHAGRLAAEYLCACDYRRLACLAIDTAPDGPAPVLRVNDLRAITGMNEVLAAAELPPVETIAAPSRLDCGPMLERRLAAGAPPEAIFCTLTHRAVEAVRTLRRLGVSIPEDIAVVTGSETPYAEAYELTAIDLRYDLIAARCRESIADTIRGDGERCQLSTVTVLPGLVVRASTRPLRHAMPPTANRVSYPRLALGAEHEDSH